MLVLEENDLEGFIEVDIPEPDGDEDKEKHKKSLVKAKRIIVDSIKDHLIPHVSSLKNPKQMVDSLSQLYEGKNINRKMTLRTQFKNMNTQDSESIQSYFTRISQIREQIEATGDSVEEAQLVMTTMNGLPRPWDPFIKGICSRRKITKFSGLWEDCTKKEARLESQEEKLGNEENQALTIHARKGKNKVENRPPKKFQKYQKKKQRNNSNIRCFNCQKVGHVTRNCLMVRDQIKNERKKRHHANAVEDEEPSQKKERNNN